MAKIRSIITLGHPLLRQTAQLVADFGGHQQLLIDDLLATVEQAGGVGIAAPQVAIVDQLMIVASRPHPRYPTAPMMTPVAMFNPRLVSHAPEVDYGWEGCLSVPGARGWVPRYRTIIGEFVDRQGQRQTWPMTDFIARIFQHELDHLQGILFIDRIERHQDLISEQDYQARVAAAT